MDVLRRWAPDARPRLREEWFSPPVDLAPWDTNVPPYDWNPMTGVSPRSVPGGVPEALLDDPVEDQEPVRG